MKMKRLVGIVLILSFSLLSCATTTVIKSEPSDAGVYINGQKMGKTPLSLLGFT